MPKTIYENKDIEKVLDYLEGRKFREVAGLILLLRSGEKVKE